jgi:hypothetical protein
VFESAANSRGKIKVGFIVRPDYCQAVKISYSKGAARWGQPALPDQSAIRPTHTGQHQSHGMGYQSDGGSLPSL